MINFSKLQTKKAQLEIFGLVIIVILVALGLLFMVVVMNKAPDKENVRIKQNLQASNFLNTALSVTLPECGGRAVRRLLQDCAMAGFENGQFIGAGSCSDNVDTCVKLNSTLDKFLQQTFGLWGSNYILFMKNTVSVEQIVVKKGTCPGEREGSYRSEVVRPGFNVDVNLHVCKPG